MRNIRHQRRLRAALLAAAGLLVATTLGGPRIVADNGSLASGSAGPGGRTEPRPDEGSGRSAGAPAASDGFSIQAEAFKPGSDIPLKFSCQGSDISPGLVWTDPPAGTQSIVLIVDDPDAPAGTWVHWVLYDLPLSARRLREALPPTAEVAGGGRQGTNDFGKIGYGGPCPPPGKPHRYFFKLYALDSRPSLKAGATKPDVEQAMKGHILAKAEMVGRYRR